jgi:uncharacterized protein (DUF1800 family)
LATPATRSDVARLFGRAAFGATKTDLDVWTGRDYAQVVDALLAPPAGQSIPLSDEVTRTQLESEQYNLTPAQKWWLERMRSTPFPLLERMTLFWHSHFATAYTSAPDVGHMMKQNHTLRTHALGSFRTLLHAMTVDGAMLYWLSGFQNRRNAVNENHARELFELFTMGTKPQQYTETDIRQAAKALTGWVVNAQRVGVFDTNRHDRTQKTILGTTIGGYPANDAREKTEYQEVCDIALAQHVAAKFVAYKMVCAFAYVPDTDDLYADPDPLVDAVANALRPAWDIKAAMRALLLHNSFRYGQRGTGQALVRSPIELIVHLGRILGASLNNTNAQTQWMPLHALLHAGQLPFRPPNVGGWPMGTDWLSAATTLGRYNLGDYMGKVWASQGLTTAATVTLPASGDIEAWIPFMGLGSLSTLTRERIAAYLASPGTSDEALKQRAVLLLIASSPDWQVM